MMNKMTKANGNVTCSRRRKERGLQSKSPNWWGGMWVLWQVCKDLGREFAVALFLMDFMAVQFTNTDAIFF